MKSKTKRLTIRIPEEVNIILEKKSGEIGISKNSFILQILWEKVKSKDIRI